jgi:uncharacterized Zn finger protein (UPF0148 family)
MGSYWINFISSLNRILQTKFLPEQRSFVSSHSWSLLSTDILSSKMSKNTNDTIKRMSDLLLVGWKLLNTSCPVCHTALLSKGGNLRCPACDLPVVTQAAFGNMSATTESLPTPPAEIKSQNYEIQDDYYNQYATGADPKTHHQSLEQEKKAYDAMNKKMDQVSNKLGEKMLSGWSMLSTVCPNDSCRGTPLVRQPDGPMMCVACETQYFTSSLGDLIASGKEGGSAASKTAAAGAVVTLATATAGRGVPASLGASQSQSQSQSLAPPPPTPTVVTKSADHDSSYYLDMHNAPTLPDLNEIDEEEEEEDDFEYTGGDLSRFSRSVDDVSSKLSRKMLLGWALLDKCCGKPGCTGNVPLMRDTSGVVSAHWFLSLFLPRIKFLIELCCVCLQEHCVQCEASNTVATTKPAAPIAVSASSTRKVSVDTGDDDDDDDEEENSRLFQRFSAAATAPGPSLAQQQARTKSVPAVAAASQQLAAVSASTHSSPVSSSAQQGPVLQILNQVFPYFSVFKHTFASLPNVVCL